MKKILKIFYNTVLTLLGLLIVLVGATLIPIPGNFKVFIVESGSMEPAVKTGSLIFVKPASNFSVGDVVTIKNGKNTVTHRIVKIDGQSVTTKGDANKEADAETASINNLVGKMLFSLPYIGYPVGYAKTKVGFMFLVIIPAVIIIYDELHRIKREIVKAWEERKKKKEKAAESPIDKLRFSENNVPRSYVSYVPPPGYNPPTPQPRPSPRRKIV
jgi:signal peptidase